MQIEYCDYRCYNPDYDRIFRPNGLGSYLFLYFFEPMYVKLKDKEIVAKAGSCLLFSPEYPQDYRAVQTFHNSYIQFYVEEENSLLYGVPVNKIFYPHNMMRIDRIVREIHEEYLAESTYKNEMMNLLFRQLLIECTRQILFEHTSEELGKMYDDFRRLRFRLLSQCEFDWKIADLCQEVHLEKSQFYEYYERFFQSSPKADVLKARMNKAKQLLTNHGTMIENIAESCGFMNASHFSRQFKRTVGCSPKEYRDQKLHNR